ncbi:MAG TPA: patatin-like phospholipase family protein [Alphaproteobacteria bacterium]|nr:patatin-like phospholipase family protein [Alphaproteobacteria bacterium]
MRASLTRAAAAVALLAVAACAASPDRTTELARIDQRAGYRYVTIDANGPKSVDKAAVLMSFSGGGTRAAALADGALRALAETEVGSANNQVPLASQIDVISSVSGGSVTSAYFALYGIDGLGNLEQNFLKRDIVGALAGRTFFNPGAWFQPRIDILSSYLDQNVFQGKTYQDLIAAEAPGRSRRPYVILNAADMATGGVFSFTQDQFDLICGDLAKLKVADAVSASAAFPVALSALTLRNHAPCAAQTAAAANPVSGWTTSDGAPAPVRIVNDRAADAAAGVAYPKAENVARFRRGTVALTYLNRDGDKKYVQLLDGGIADNLGLTQPFRLLTSPNESPSFLNQLNTGRVNKVLLVVVNARGESDKKFGESPTPPGVTDMLLTSIGTPIDGTSFQFLGQLDQLLDDRFKPKSIVLVDFDLIADRACRSYFHNMATSWTLPPRQVDDLIALGKAMVLQSPRYQAMVAALGGRVPPARPTVEEICARARLGS